MKKLLFIPLLFAAVNSWSYGFVQMLRGPGSCNANQTEYSAMGIGDIEDGQSTTTENIMMNHYLTAGTASSMWIFVKSNTMTATSTVTVRINGANGNELIPVAAGKVGTFTVTANDFIASGSSVDIAVIGSTGTGNIAVFNAGFVFTPQDTTINMQKFIVMTHQGPDNNSFATYYTGASGANGIEHTQTETNGPETIMPLSGTIKNLCVSVSDDSLSLTQHATFRLNHANTVLIDTIPAGTSGIFCDTINVVNVVAGSSIDYSYNMGSNSSTGYTTVWWISAEFITTGNQQVYLYQNTNHSPTGGSTEYAGYIGAQSWDISDSIMQEPALVAGTFSNMSVSITSAPTGNTITTPVPLNFRKNGANGGGNGSEFIVIPDSAQGYYTCNSTQTDTVAPTDYITTSETTDVNSMSVNYYSWIFTVPANNALGSLYLK